MLKKSKNNSIWSKISTFGPIGYLTSIPGTIGTIIALPLVWLFRFSLDLSNLAYICLILSISLFSYFVLYLLEVEFGKKFSDDKVILLDEFAGIWWGFILFPNLCYLNITEKVFTIVIIFLLFRLLDIFKPWPVYLLEKIPGALGVLLDDIIAGLLSGGLFSVIFVIFMLIFDR